MSNLSVPYTGPQGEGEGAGPKAKGGASPLSATHTALRCDQRW